MATVHTNDTSLTLPLRNDLGQEGRLRREEVEALRNYCDRVLARMDGTTDCPACNEPDGTHLIGCVEDR